MAGAVKSVMRSTHFCDDGRVATVGVFHLVNGHVVPEQVAVHLGGVGIIHLRVTWTHVRPQCADVFAHTCESARAATRSL